MAWCSYLAIYIAVVDSCLEYNLHKKIYMHASITPSIQVSACYFTFHVAAYRFFPPHIHIHVGEIELVVCLSIHQSVSQSNILLQSLSRVIYRGGGGGGGPGIPPPPPEILKLSMVIILAIYMLLNISMCHQNVVWKFCPRLRQKQSERM